MTRAGAAPARHVLTPIRSDAWPRIESRDATAMQVLRRFFSAGPPRPTRRRLDGDAKCRDAQTRARGPRRCAPSRAGEPPAHLTNLARSRTTCPATVITATPGLGGVMFVTTGT